MPYQLCIICTPMYTGSKEMSIKQLSGIYVTFATQAQNNPFYYVLTIKKTPIYVKK